jgi:LysR family hydrogen peroxide-inducible transcriptional activator
MTITQLEYIIAVATHKNFSVAAEKCFVTQPTLSMQIQKLEGDLGTLIFDRSKQPIMPTEQGIALIAQARIVLAEANRLQEIAKEQQTEIQGELRLGVISTLAPYLLPLFLKKFSDKYPKVSLHIEEMPTERIIENLKNDLLDGGLLATPLLEAQLKEIPLFYEPFMAYVSPDSEVANKRQLIPQDLENQTVFLLGDTHCFRLQVMQICNTQTNKSPNLQLNYKAGSLETLKRMVDLYGGITLLPELAIHTLTEDQFEQIRYFTEPPPAREISLVVHRNFVKQKIFEVLQKEILEVIPKKMLQRGGYQIIGVK